MKALVAFLLACFACFVAGIPLGMVLRLLGWW